MAVGAGSCLHDDPPRALPRGLTRDQGVEAAKEHPGLCGVYLAGISYDDVVATAERRSASVTFNVFRNQVRAVVLLLDMSTAGLLPCSACRL